MYLNRNRNSINADCCVLPGEEINRLILKAQDGCDESREKVILANIKLVFSLASKYIQTNVEEEDLISEGIIGLMVAINKFKPRVKRKGKKTYASFCTYSSFWIKQKMNRYTQRNRSIIRIPDTTYRNSFKIMNAVKEIINKHGEDVDLNKHIDMKKISPNNTTNLKTAYMVSKISVASLDATSLSFHVQPMQGIEMTKDMIKDLIKIEMIHLDIPQRNKDIVIDNFGLTGNEPMVLRELADKYKLTKERCRQIIHDTVRLLKTILLDMKIDIEHCRL